MLQIDKRKDNPSGTLAYPETKKLARLIGTEWYHECSAKDDMGREDVKKVFEKAALAATTAPTKKRNTMHKRCNII